MAYSTNDKKKEKKPECHDSIRCLPCTFQVESRVPRTNEIKLIMYLNI